MAHMIVFADEAIIREPILSALRGKGYEALCENYASGDARESIEKGHSRSRIHGRPRAHDRWSDVPSRVAFNSARTGCYRARAQRDAVAGTLLVTNG
jgi:hypothetical protein